MRIRKASGLQKRWQKNNVSIMLGLVVLTVLIFSIFVGVYYYSSLSAGLRAKAKTTTVFFGNYIINKILKFPVVSGFCGFH